MADFPLFPFTTQEDWYGELQFLSADDGNAPLPLTGRTFEMPITEAAQGGSLIEPVRTLTMAQGGGLSFKTGGTDTLVFRVPRAVARNFARVEYTADVLEVIDGERHLFMPVRIRYSEPSGLLSYVSRFLGVSVTFLSRLQPIVTPVAITGRQGIPGATIITGTAPPVPATGKDGDYFIEDRTASSQGRRMYGPKAGGAWPGTPWVIQVTGIADVPGLPQKLQAQDDETAKRTLPADVKKFLTDMLGLEVAAAALLSAGLVTAAGADGLKRSLADWTKDIPVTVSSYRTVLDASPAVAVQRALDRSRTVIVDGDYDTSGYILRLKSGHRLVGRGDNARLIVAADPADMSYRLPLLMLEDVRGILVENLTVEYTYRSSVPSRQYGALCRASAPGFCGGILWRNVTFKGAPVHNEPGVEGVIFDACTMDGKATITNPQPGGLLGVSSGGSRLNLATGQQESAAGAAKDIMFWKCRMANFRSEAIDCDVAWNVRIYSCTITNWGCDGSANEAIDIGGVATDGTVCRDIWIEDNTLDLTHVDAQGAPVAIPGSGIHVKLGTVGAIVRGNRVRSNTATSSAGPAIILEDDGTTGEVSGNTTFGFRQGVAVNNTPNARIPVRGNTCEGFFETGVASSNGGGVSVFDNDIIGLAAGSSLSAIRLLGCTDYLKGGNRISGKFNAQVTFIDANSTGCALPDLNRATAAGGPANAGAASTYASDMLAALNGLSRSGGTVTGTINHTGAYNLTGTLTNVSAASILSRHSSDANAAQITARKSRGTAAAPEALAQNDLASGLFSQGYTGSAYANLMTLTARVIAATPSSSDMQSRLEIALNAAGATVPATFLSGDHATGLSLFGQPVVDQNRHIRHRVYTRVGLPTPTASNVGEARVSNPETGKSPLVYNTGSTWVYVNDNSAVSLTA